MGGEIWVESEVNVGSRFIFSLPYKGNLDNKLNLRNKNEPDSKFENLAVLIVEDNETNYFVLEKILIRKKIEVFWSDNGQKAVDFYKNYRNEKDLIILMDIKMPIMDGYEAYEKIRGISDSVPVIAVTAYAQLNEKKKIQKAGFTDYIAKPINDKILFEMLIKYRRHY